MTNLFLTFGGRKFTLVSLVVFLTTILTWFGKVSETTFSYVVCAVVLGYIGSNVIQKYQESKQTEKEILLNE